VPQQAGTKICNFALSSTIKREREGERERQTDRQTEKKERKKEIIAKRSITYVGRFHPFTGHEGP